MNELSKTQMAREIQEMMKTSSKPQEIAHLVSGADQMLGAVSQMQHASWRQRAELRKEIFDCLMAYMRGTL